MLKELLRGALALALVISLLPSCEAGTEDEQIPDSVPADSVDAIALYPGLALPPQPEETNYLYTEEEDEMTDTKTRYARLLSDNTVTLDFPYGECRLSYLIRKTAKYGTDVMLCISSGQFHGNEYNGDNYVTVRFDSLKPVKYYFLEPTDGSPEWIFLQNKKDFIRRAKQAHQIRIEVPLYQEGRRLFRFHSPEPLKWE